MFIGLKFWLHSHLFTGFTFWWCTKIKPRFAPHYWCEFYDWSTKKITKGWYILDRKGKMIPWVHYGNGCIMCLYENMIKKFS